VLAFTQKHVMLMTGNPVTKHLLEEHGCTVVDWDGDEIAKKGGGGPKCLANGETFTHCNQYWKGH